MHARFAVAAVLAVALVPSPSRAQLQLGLRAGWSSGMGDALEISGDPFVYGPPHKEAQSSWIDWQIPLQLDVGWRVTRELTVGAYASYGFASAGDPGCGGSGASCSAQVARAGIEATWSFASVSRRWWPWVGLGAGYEWSKVSASLYGVSGSTTLKGLEYLNLQAGADWRLGDTFGLGPYLMFSLGEYSAGDFDSSYMKGTLHEWLGVGVRATYDL